MNLELLKYVIEAALGNAFVKALKIATPKQREDIQVAKNNVRLAKEIPGAVNMQRMTQTVLGDVKSKVASGRKNLISSLKSGS